jgi:hypothetical protein
MLAAEKCPTFIGSPAALKYTLERASSLGKIVLDCTMPLNMMCVRLISCSLPIVVRCKPCAPWITSAAVQAAYKLEKNRTVQREAHIVPPASDALAGNKMKPDPTALVITTTYNLNFRACH